MLQRFNPGCALFVTLLQLVCPIRENPWVIKPCVGQMGTYLLCTIFPLFVCVHVCMVVGRVRCLFPRVRFFFFCLLNDIVSYYIVPVHKY